MTVAMREATTDAAEFQPRKLEAAISFFLQHANNVHLGKTKLMKLLYYADFDHFEQHGRPITGSHYRKLDHGPVPDEAWDMLQKMGNDDTVRHQQRIIGGYSQDHYEAVGEPDLSVLSEEERSTLKQVAERWQFHSRQQIVDATHGEAPWLAVRLGETIPYYLAYYRNNFGAMELDEDERGSTMDEKATFPG